MNELIYLDNNATTAVSAAVWKQMAPYFCTYYGNASSTQHRLGRQASEAIENARQQIADELNCTGKEITFNSGATEAINMVIKGIYERYSLKGKHIITAQTEHQAVRECCLYLQQKGAEITYLAVDQQGQIDCAHLAESIRPDTILVCLMAANNETGVLHPIAEIARICQEKQTLYFCDATQYLGKFPLDLQAIPIDILCFSGHKLQAPKGIGALFIRRKSKPIQISSLLHGGGQENGWRSGSSNVPLIVGLGQAVADLSKIRSTWSYIGQLRDNLEASLQRELEAISIHAVQAPRLPNTSYISFHHVLATELMLRIPDIALSAGAACSTGKRRPSAVLQAMGLPDDQSLSAIRFSLGLENTAAEMEIVSQSVRAAVQDIRAQSPIWALYQEGLLD